jgi:parallel beta-helix repeat protein
MKLKPALLVLSALLLSSCKQEIEPYDVHKITRSNTTIDCKGGQFNSGKSTEIRVISDVKNVTIKNCKLKGSIRIYGLGMNGEDEEVKKSSHKEGHTSRTQKAAPSNVLISNMIIEGVQRIPVYLSPGVTKTTIENSKFIGTTDSSVIYLDAESAYNTIRNNSFNVSGNFTLRQFRIREVIAVDGSAHNTISGNSFQRAIGGGIYLYRNCGEGGTVRHQSPQYNIIENNNFNLSGLHLNNYGIWLGARNGNRFYCNADEGHKFGSSVDNRDFADYNIVKGNKFSGSDRTIKNDGSNNSVK